MRAILLTALLLAATGAQARSCRSEVGAARAGTYVDQCLQVSPATHPPCNAANPCDLILGEIRRGCALLDADAPAFCADPGSDAKP